MIITKTEAEKILKTTSGKIFTVKFRKRTDGTIRTMNCRKGVKKGVKNVGMPYNADKKGLIPVCDMQLASKLKKMGKSIAGAYRVIAVEGILEMNVRGIEYQVK